MKRKERMNYSNEQKLEYARMMVENNYSNQQIQDISGASLSAIVRWKRQYLSERNGNTPLIGNAIRGQFGYRKLLYVKSGICSVHDANLLITTIAYRF